MLYTLKQCDTVYQLYFSQKTKKEAKAITSPTSICVIKNGETQVKAVHQPVCLIEIVERNAH